MWLVKSEKKEEKKKQLVVVHVRFELTTFALSARRSADWANGPADNNCV